MSESILLKAEEIINGQRAKDYGDAWENHLRIATLWAAYKPGVEFSPEDVAVMMILLKIARFMENGYHHDTVIDIAGYAGVLEKMQLPEGERYSQPREWMRLEEVPKDVEVVDAGGHYWKWTTCADGDTRRLWTSHGRWLWTSHGRVFDSSKFRVAPFTEVLARHNQKEAT